MIRRINQSYLYLCILTMSLVLPQALWAEALEFRKVDRTGIPSGNPITTMNVDWTSRSSVSWPVACSQGKEVSPVSYQSSNSAIATVNANGAVEVKAYSGTVTITATYTGTAASYDPGSYILTIVDDRSDPKDLNFGFSSTTASATYGDEGVTLPSLNMGQLSGAAVTYSSSVQGVATVDNAGSVTIKGAGSTEISASFAGNDYTKPGSASYTLTVAQKEVGLMWGTTEFTYDGNAHAPTATATGLVGNDACTVTVDGAQTNAGSNYIATASALSNANYKLPATNTTTFSIAKAASSVTKVPTANSLTYTGSAQALLTAGTASGGTMNYSLDNKTFTETIPLETNVGSYTVYYKVVGDANHEDAAGGQVVVSIAKATPTVTFASKTANAKMGETYAGQTATTSPEGLVLKYSSTNTAVATVNESTGAVSLVGAGSTTIKASFEGNTNYNAAEDSYTLTIAKDDAVSADLSFSSQTATATYGDASVTTPTLSNPHQLSLTWSSSKESVATVNSSGAVTIKGAGQTVISAAFAGNDSYSAATISYTLTVNKAAATVTFASKTANAKMGETYAGQTATTSPEGLVLKYSSTNTAVATVNESTGAVSLVGAGSTTIKASFEGNTNYNAAEDSYTLTIAKDDAVSADLSFSSQTATATYGDASVTTPTLSNPHQLSLTWSSSKESVATVNSSGAVTIKGAGQTVISAAFAGNDSYSAATISYTLTVNKAAATVTFASKTANAKMGETYAGQTATTSPEGLVLKYSSTNTAVATVNESTGAVSLVGAGSTTIKASFDGNTNYNAAEDSYTLTVSKADAVEVELSFASDKVTATYGDGTVSAPSLNNPQQLSLTWSSSNVNVATIGNNNKIQIVGAGQTVISAAFAGDDTYQAKTVSFTLTVNKAAVTVTFDTEAETATLGEPFTSPKATITPRDLQLVYSSTDKYIAKVEGSTGEVTLRGVGTVKITATFKGSDNYESASASYELTVLEGTLPPPTLEPIVKEEDYWMDEEFFINADGSEVDLSNTIINDILFTLKNQSSPEGDGYDTEEKCIVINIPTSASTLDALLANGVEPGSEEYASQFTGMTFMVPPGDGYVIVTSQEAEGAYLMAKVGDSEPVAIHMEEMGDYDIPYLSDEITFVYLWKAGTGFSNDVRTRGKKTMSDVKVRGVSHKSKGRSGIQQVYDDAAIDQPWYDLSGQRITKPVKKGVYIHGNRKVVIK